MKAEQIIFDGGIPECYSECNTVVLAMHQSHETKYVLLEWKSIYEAQISGSIYSWIHDQLSFRQAVYNSSLRVHVLPSEYNFCIPFPGYAGGPVKNLHGRHSHLLEIGRRLNLMGGPRAASAMQFARQMVVYSD